MPRCLVAVLEGMVVPPVSRARVFLGYENANIPIPTLDLNPYGFTNPDIP